MFTEMSEAEKEDTQKLRVKRRKVPASMMLNGKGTG